jgi:hypothetical protein
LYIPAFEEFAGEERLFFADYFIQKPLLRRDAIMCDTRELLSVDNLDELLHRESLQMPYVAIARPESSYRQTTRIQGETVCPITPRTS